MIIDFNRETARTLLSLRPDPSGQSDGDQDVIDLFEDVRKEVKEMGLPVPPPVDFAAIEKGCSSGVEVFSIVLKESPLSGEKVSFAIFEYEYLTFISFFLETLIDEAKEAGADTSLLEDVLDEILDWQENDEDHSSSTVQ